MNSCLSPRILGRSEMYTASSRIWTRVTNSISYHDICYAKRAYTRSEVWGTYWESSSLTTALYNTRQPNIKSQVRCTICCICCFLSFVFIYMMIWIFESRYYQRKLNHALKLHKLVHRACSSFRIHSFLVFK